MGERERERERVHGSRRDREGGKWRDHDGEGDDDKRGESKKEKGNGFGEPRGPNGGTKSLLKGGEGRPVGEGVEGTGEILLTGPTHVNRQKEPNARGKGRGKHGSEEIFCGSGEENDVQSYKLGKSGAIFGKLLGLKGSLGLAKLEDSKVLLEFELLEEAKRASLSGEKRMGAIRLGFEEWRPWDGCREEKEDSEEIWVRIFGLPVLLWNPTVLRRVGEECGGFIDIDSKTKKLEELQWARILVRSAGGDKPSTLEIGIEEEVFTLALWWESRPTVRKIRVDSRRWGEVRDDSKARADSRVEMEPVGERNEALVPSEEETGRQVRKMGWEGTEDWAHQSGPMGFRVFGPDLSGLKLKGVMEEGEGLQAGPSNTWAVEGVGLCG
ncbi:hypothetical protein CK203_070372 [Vitis vinifera]|uniref:Uncharacterized protein n=1 Tax=Vitis vinifera TaxID=29760 RepID=A0A438E6L7_VITVI|nr:hypothetical protein CK203_070372 [Vitis vinifera]